MKLSASAFGEGCKNPAGRRAVRGNAERATNRGVGEAGPGQPGRSGDWNAPVKPVGLRQTRFRSTLQLPVSFPPPVPRGRFQREEKKRKRVPVLGRSNVCTGLRRSLWETGLGHISNGEGVSLPLAPRAAILFSIDFTLDNEPLSSDKGSGRVLGES